MTGRRVVVLDHAFGSVDAERDVALAHGARFEVFQCRSAAETRDAARDADVAFVNFAPVDADVVAALAPGAVVIRYGIGYDNVDLGAVRAAGVRLANVPDYGADTVADHTVALMLAALRRVVEFDAAIRAHGWVGPTVLGAVPGLADTTIGLVGTGRIGLQVAARLAVFGCTVQAYDPFAPDSAFGGELDRVDLADLLATSDVVSLHCPLTADTHHLVDRRTLAAMKPGALLVNTSRGGLVDTDAVLDALDSGRLGGAALDVFEVEPLPADSRLRTHPRTILTPHAAFYSTRSLRALQQLAAGEAGRALRGEPLRCPVLDGSGPGSTGGLPGNR
jgi:D-3-phosphoglycerate dehydrogenase